MKPSIELLSGRSHLNEGRQYGVSFGFLKKDGDKFKGVMPVSACKDYLNDVVYIENSGGDPFTVYGLSTTKQDTFKEGAFLAMSSLTYDKYSVVGDRDEVEQLKSNHGLMQKLTNVVEEMLGLKDRTIITPVEDNLYLLQLPMEWVSSPYAISAYGLIVRSLLWAKEGDDLKTALGRTKSFDDAGNLKYAIRAIKCWASIGMPKCPKYVSNTDNRFTIHDGGMIAWCTANMSKLP